MFERIFACLLHLYPSRFRESYEKEARQLLRERFRDETGPIRRLRLCVDLLMDFAFGLPQAYRTTEGTVAAAPVRQHGIGIPSFELLNGEKTGFGPFLLGSVFSLTALGIFSFILSHPSTYEPLSGSKHRITPIEAVMERLNRPASESTINIREREIAVRAAQATAATANGAPLPAARALPPSAPKGLPEAGERQGVAATGSRGRVIVVWPSQATAATANEAPVPAATAMPPSVPKGFPEVREQQSVAMTGGRRVAGQYVQSGVPESAILGVWQGELGGSRRDLQIIAKISKTETGALMVTFQRVGREQQLVSSTSSSFQDGRLQFAIQSIDGKYEGRMAGDGMSISGIWIQGASSQPLLLRRITGEARPF